MTTKKSPHLLLLAVAVVAGSLLAAPQVAWASSWVPTLASGGSGLAKAQAAPAAPTGVGAVCTSSAGKTIRVTWNAVAHASYAIYKSTTSASSGYSLLAA